jgi:hypothetical protein
MLLRLVFTLGVFAGLIYGCDCVEVPASQARRNSEVAFRGTVAKFRDSGKGYRIVVFKVSRVWKGQIGRQFEMPAEEGDWCYAFLPSLLKIGNELVVYASKLPEGTSGDYFPMPCNTRLARDTKEFALGPGRHPRPK